MLPSTERLQERARATGVRAAQLKFIEVAWVIRLFWGWRRLMVTSWDVTVSVML